MILKHLLTLGKHSRNFLQTSRVKYGAEMPVMNLLNLLS